MMRWIIYSYRHGIHVEKLYQLHHASYGRNPDFIGWTNDHLQNYEQSLFDDEGNGADNWELREEVLKEIAAREPL